MGAEGVDIDYKERYEILFVAYDQLCRKYEQLDVINSKEHWENHEMRQMLKELIVAVTDCRHCAYNDNGCNLWNGGKCNLEERNVKRAKEMGIFIGDDELVGDDE